MVPRTQWVTSFSNPSSRRFDAFLWLPRTTRTYMVHKHACRKNTYTHKINQIKIFLKNPFFWKKFFMRIKVYLIQREFFPLSTFIRWVEHTAFWTAFKIHLWICHLIFNIAMLKLQIFRKTSNFLLLIIVYIPCKNIIGSILLSFYLPDFIHVDAWHIDRHHIHPHKNIK